MNVYVYVLCHLLVLLQVRRKRRPATHGDIGNCDTMQLVQEMAGRPNEYNTNTFKQYDMLTEPDGKCLALLCGNILCTAPRGPVGIEHNDIIISSH
jgi:hypothetical protein